MYLHLKCIYVFNLWKYMRWKNFWRATMSFGYLIIFFKSFIHFERERQREWAETEGERENPKQALHHQHRALCRARTHEAWDHDLSWSQTPNRLSHPGALYIFFYIFNFWRTGKTVFHGGWAISHSHSNERGLRFTICYLLFLFFTITIAIPVGVKNTEVLCHVCKVASSRDIQVVLGPPVLAMNQGRAVFSRLPHPFRVTLWQVGNKALYRDRKSTRLNSSH